MKDMSDQTVLLRRPRLDLTHHERSTCYARGFCAGVFVATVGFVLFGYFWL